MLGPNPVCAHVGMQKPRMWPQRDRVALVGPDQHVNPATKIDQCVQKARARHAHSKYFVLDHPGSRPKKSARMRKHANEKRAGAGHSNVCSRLHAPTHATAPGRAIPAPRHALLAPQRRRRQHTDLENTNILDKEDSHGVKCTTY